MSRIVIFVPCMNESPLGEWLASICSVSVDDIPNDVSEFSCPSSRFHKGDGMV